MTPRQRRFLGAFAVLAGVATAAAVLLSAVSENLLFFYTPSQVAAGEVPADRTVRVGGLVVSGSIERNPDSLAVRFQVTDMARVVPVSYEGILPDLFREGQGIIAQGRIDANGVFQATEVLAKHDENYMPPEVAATLAMKGEGPLAPVHPDARPADARPTGAQP
ncbi:MAG TPA: cytochrome c maturation protein CcmE [Gammaproteobacteria bacterium]|nr:cytochrome c maturation protein CcmE [Gammaproteobacteria bacterium]